MSSFKDVIEEARTSWLANYAIGDNRWRLQQLYGLHELVLNNREKIISALVSVQSVPTIAYEKEIAIFVKGLQSHISTLNKNSPPKFVKSSNWGQVFVEERPRGVSLILSNSPNPIRFALAPLAASIAANNVVILATPAGSENAFTSLLTQEWSKYLSPEMLFFLPGINIADIKVDNIDHIAILDSSPDEYSAILQYHEAHFYSIATGYNIAVVDEGKKNWGSIAKQIIMASSTEILPSDRLSAVIIRLEDKSEFRQASNDKWNMDKMDKMAIGCENSHLPNCDTWDDNTFSLDATGTEGSEKDCNLSLEDNLCRAQVSGRLLVVLVTSLEKGLNLLNEMSSSIQQLALLAPGSSRTASYVRKWTHANTFSIRSIQTALHPVFDNAESQVSFETLFPSTLFSRSRVIVEKPLIGLPDSVLGIRAAYEKLIPPLKPEPRGERIGFFKQAEYLVKGVGITIFILAGTGFYFGTKVLRKRFL